MSKIENFTQVIIIKGHASHIYDICRDYISFPSFLSYVKDIQQMDDEVTHWRIVNERGEAVTWKARFTKTDEDRRIGWNTVEGDIKISGQAVFSELPQEQTQIALTVKYVLPHDLPVQTQQKIREELEQKVIEELSNLKKHAEGMEERLTRRRS